MKLLTNRKLIALAYALAVIAALSSAAWAKPTKVGNGDDGDDLEGATLINSGPILDAREKAIVLVKSLGTSGIQSLGNLLPELSRSPIYLAKKDVSAQLEGDQGSFHADLRGRVYARTFARPHAPTRFFPVAVKLDEDQLVSLHIHEALHRSLDPSVRENEAAVSAITLSITSPESNYDQVRETVAKYVPESSHGPAAQPGEMMATSSSATLKLFENEPEIPSTAQVLRPSLFGYSFRQFLKNDEASQSVFQVDRMHVLQSYLYPFGTRRIPLGIGIEASFIQRPTASQMGPLSLSARMRLWTVRGFDIAGWGVTSLNTLSNEELKSSPVGRDVLTVGLSMERVLDRFFVENSLSYTFKSSAEQTIANVPYKHDFGGTVSAKVQGGLRAWKFRIGGYAELLLADYYRLSGDDMDFVDIGRYRILAGGPEISWVDESFRVTLAGRLKLDSTREANFDHLGNIMGQGAAQGSLGASVSLNF